MLLEELQLLLEMPVLRQDQTGLKFQIQVDQKRASHSMRVKVSIIPHQAPSKNPSNYTFSLVVNENGDSFVAKNTAHIAEKASQEDTQAVQQWIKTNRNPILKLWNGQYSNYIEFGLELNPRILYS